MVVLCEKKNRSKNQNQDKTDEEKKSCIIYLLMFCIVCCDLQTHLICTVPPYADTDIVEPVTVQMLVTSSNKFSEPHNFVYTPKSAFGPGALAMASTLASLQHAHNKSIQGILTVFIILY